MMSLINLRRIQIGLLLLTSAVILASFYFQYFLHLQPCPLCLMQRVCSILCGIFCLFGFLCVERRCLLNTLIASQLIVALAGIFFALRQVWLQFSPAGHTAVCLPGIDVLMKYFSWQNIVHAFVWGTSECGETAWQILGIPMPIWSALYFAIVIVASGYLLYCNRRSLII